MIGLLIIAHGGFGKSLIESATHVMGQRPARLEALTVAPEDSPEWVVSKARDLLVPLDTGEGVLVFADICGATPCNVANQLRRPGHIEVVSGANLPMLVRALTYRESPLPTALEKALTGGHEGIMHHPLSHPTATEA